MAEPVEVATLTRPELVCHLFAPLDGPAAQTARTQLDRIWAFGRSRLRINEPVPGVHRPARPPDSDHLGEGVLAVAQNAGTDRQLVLRRVHDLVVLSVAFRQPVAGPTGLGWVEFLQLWSQACASGTDALLGEGRLFLGLLAGPAPDDLGPYLKAALPYREDRPRGWWDHESLTLSGIRLWDTRCGDDLSPGRELIVLGPDSADRELSTLVWSDGGSEVALPPLARYLIHAVKLRYEARVLDRWRSSRPGRPPALPDEPLSDSLPSAQRDRIHRSRAELLRARDGEASSLEADLEELRHTCEIARSNLEDAGRIMFGSGGKELPADHELTAWLIAQLGDDLEYLRITRKRIRDQLEQAALEPGPARVPAGDPRRIFVVHGRDNALTQRFFDFLAALGLKPQYWERLVAATSSTAPYIGQVVADAPSRAQANLVLLSPDDVVRLHPDLVRESDDAGSAGWGAQARPNVIFELGQALLANPENTIVVEVGRMRTIGDLQGLNTIKFDGRGPSVFKLFDRLRQAGCPVDDAALEHWLGDRFRDLAALTRQPGDPGLTVI